MSVFSLYRRITNRTIDDMKNTQSSLTNSLLPDFNLVVNVETVRIFSDLCEDTCSNLFLYSPYQLHLGREEFLHFQNLADELREYVLNGSDISFEQLYSLCSDLNTVYRFIMQSCWDAFVCSPDIDAEPGKFILQQQVAVNKFNKSAYLCINAL